MTVRLKPETEAAIRAKAHQIWEEEGRPEGRQDIHWQLAYDAVVNAAAGTPTAAVADKPARAKVTKAKVAAKKK